jgi:hypothetical protein
MAGVLECIKRPQKHLIKPGLTLDEASLKAIELQTAKEILAEIFHASPSDVDDMIRRRLADESLPGDEIRSEEIDLWPEMFWVK